MPCDPTPPSHCHTALKQTITASLKPTWTCPFKGPHTGTVWPSRHWTLPTQKFLTVDASVLMLRCWLNRHHSTTSFPNTVLALFHLSSQHLRWALSCSVNQSRSLYSELPDGYPNIQKIFELLTAMMCPFVMATLINMAVRFTCIYLYFSFKKWELFKLCFGKLGFSCLNFEG